MWLAERTEANYIGITISEKQVELARRYASKRVLGDRVKFILQNYFDTTFESGAFNKIFAIESFCYSYPNPKILCEEMYRILKPGGTVVVSDGILLRRPQNKEEEKLAENFCIGFKMSGWSTSQEITSAFKEAGFSNVRYIDKTKEIKKSVIDIYWRTILASPLRLLRYIGLITKAEADQLLATVGQKKMYEKGLFGYGVFIAQKESAI